MNASNKSLRIALIITAVIAVLAIIAVILLLPNNQSSPSVDSGSEVNGTTEPTIAQVESDPVEIPYQFELNNYVATVYGLDPTNIDSASPEIYYEYESLEKEVNILDEISQRMTELQPKLTEKFGSNITTSCKVLSHTVISKEQLSLIAESAAVYGVAVESMKYGYTVDFAATISGSKLSVTCPVARRTMLLIDNRWYCVVVEENVTFPLEPFVYFFGLDNLEQHPFSTKILKY